MNQEKAKYNSMNEKTKSVCPYFKKSMNHGNCMAYPDGLMNPSLDEMMTFCLTSSYSECLYYRLLKKTDTENHTNEHCVIV